MFQVLQQDLGKVGVTLKGKGVPDADFYTKYLQKPDSARSGQWDVSAAGWGPDWYGDGALSFFNPLFSGAPAYPPVNSSTTSASVFGVQGRFQYLARAST